MAQAAVDGFNAGDLYVQYLWPCSPDEIRDKSHQEESFRYAQVYFDRMIRAASSNKEDFLGPIKPLRITCDKMLETCKRPNVVAWTYTPDNHINICETWFTKTHDENIQCVESTKYLQDYVSQGNGICQLMMKMRPSSKKLS